MDADLTEGLKAVHQDLAVGHGFAQLDLGAAQDKGLFARAEAGFRPTQDVSLFGFAEAGTQEEAVAGVGARIDF